MRHDDWKTAFGQALLERCEERITKHLKDLENTTDHDKSMHLRGRLKEVRWLLALKDESSTD